MGGSHAHRKGDDGVEVQRGPRTVLLGVLAAFAVATVVGLVALWPQGERVDRLAEQVDFAADGVTFPVAEVLEVQPACASAAETSSSVECGRARVRVTEGDDEGRSVQVPLPPDVQQSGLDEGDEIRLIRTPAVEDVDVALNYFGTVRTQPVLILAGLFAVVVLAVARLRGLYALFGLVFAGAVMWFFVLPALLSGEPALLVGAVGSAAIMFVVLYTTHGWSMRTSAALAGTLVGIAMTAGLALVSVASTRLSGLGDDAGRVLATAAGDLSLQGLFTCAVLIAGLGVLNDVTITQASAVWEIRGAAPTMSRRRVFAAGMRIGRDHIASTIYTIVFAYAGTALFVLLVLSLYDRPFLELLATEEIGQEVVRTLATSIGLVLAVPVTTLIAVATLPAADLDEVAEQAPVA